MADGTDGDRGDSAGTARDGADAFAPDRWSELARAIGVEADAPVVLALSGGADSVYLLHVLAHARPRPRILAVHVDHGWRGEASRADAEFCARACAALGVPFRLERVTCAVDGPSPESRAREARYDALLRVARAEGVRTLATAHQRDDALETLVARWIRGTAVEGLAALRPRIEAHAGLFATPVRRARADTAASARSETECAPDTSVALVRPLLGERAEDVRAALRQHGIEWREDASNRDPRFARNRIRHVLLPRLAAVRDAGFAHQLDAFARALAELDARLAPIVTAHVESDVAAPTAPVPVGPSVARESSRHTRTRFELPRAPLAALPPAVLSRVLWTWAARATGAAPGRVALERFTALVLAGRPAESGLARGFVARVGPRRVRLVPAAERVAPRSNEAWILDVPGRVAFADGRAIEARWHEPDASVPCPASRDEVDLDVERLDGPLVVRFPRDGDRFHGLGAPGSKRLTRFLADCGVAREARGSVPLVVAGERIAWVAGVRPSDWARVGPDTRRRLRLRLVAADAGPRGDAVDAFPAAPPEHGDER